MANYQYDTRDRAEAQRIESRKYPPIAAGFHATFKNIRDIAAARGLPFGATAYLLNIASEIFEPGRRPDQGTRVMMSRRLAAAVLGADEKTVTRARKLLVAERLILPVPEIGADCYDLSPIFLDSDDGAVEGKNAAKPGQIALEGKNAPDVSHSFVFSKEKTENSFGGILPSPTSSDLDAAQLDALRCAPRLGAAISAALERKIEEATWADVRRVIAENIGEICGAYGVAQCPVDQMTWNRAAETHGGKALIILAYILECAANEWKNVAYFPGRYMGAYVARGAMWELASNLATLRQIAEAGRRRAEEAETVERTRRAIAELEQRKTAQTRAAKALHDAVISVAAEPGTDREAIEEAIRSIVAFVAVSGDDRGAPCRVFWSGRRVDDLARDLIEKAMRGLGLPPSALVVDRTLPSAVKLSSVSLSRATTTRDSRRAA